MADHEERRHLRADVGRARILVVATQAGLPQDVADRVHLLTDQERRRAAAFARAADANAFLAAHVLVRVLVEDHTGVPAAAVELTRGPCPWCGRPGRGAPWVPAAPGVHVSLTHTPGLVAVALALAPVGVDVEGLEPTGPLDTVMAELDPSEQAELDAVPSAGRARAIMRCWVRKEAVLKGIGVGIGHGVRWPMVGTGTDEQSLHVGPGWRVDDLPVPSGFVGAIALGEGIRTPLSAVGARR